MHFSQQINCDKTISKFLKLNEAIKEYNQNSEPINGLFTKHGFKKITNKVEVVTKFDHLIAKIGNNAILDMIDVQTWQRIEQNARVFSKKAVAKELHPQAKKSFENHCLTPILEYLNALSIKEKLPLFLNEMRRVIDDPKKYTFNKSFTLQELPCRQTALPRNVIDKCLEYISILQEKNFSAMIPVELWIEFQQTCQKYIETFFNKETEKKQQIRRLLPLTKLIEEYIPSKRLDRMASNESNFTPESIVQTLETIANERVFVRDVLLDAYFELIKGLALQRFSNLGGKAREYDSVFIEFDWMKMREIASPEEMGLCLRLEAAYRDKNYNVFTSVLRQEISNKENLTESAKLILTVWQLIQIISDLDSFEYKHKDSFFDDEKRDVRNCTHLKMASPECLQLLQIAQTKILDPEYLRATMVHSSPSERIEYLKKYIGKINAIGLSIQQKIEQANAQYKLLYDKLIKNPDTKYLLQSIQTPEQFKQQSIAICNIDFLNRPYEELFQEAYVDALSMNDSEFHYSKLFDGFILLDPYCRALEASITSEHSNQDTSEKIKEVQKSTQDKVKPQNIGPKHNKSLAERVLQAHMKEKSLEKEQEQQQKIAKVTEKMSRLRVKELEFPATNTKNAKRKRKRNNQKPIGKLVQHMDHAIGEKEIAPTEKEKEKEVEFVPTTQFRLQPLEQIRERPIIEKRIEVDARIKDWFLDSPESLKTEKYKHLQREIQNKVKLFHTYPLFMTQYEQKYGMRIAQLSTGDKRTCSYTLVGQIECYGENSLDQFGNSKTYRGFFTSTLDGNRMYHHCFTERPYNEILEEVSRQGFLKLDEELNQENITAEKGDDQSLNPDKARYKITKTAHTVTCDDLQEKVRYIMCLSKK